MRALAADFLRGAAAGLVIMRSVKRAAVPLILAAVGAAFGCSGSGSGSSGRASSVAPVTSGTAPVTSGTAPVTSGTAPTTSGGITVSPPASGTVTSPPATASTVSRFLYVANAGTNNLSLYAIDQKAGTLKTVAMFACMGGAPGALAKDPAEKLLFVLATGVGANATNTVLTYSIDPQSGFLKLLSSPLPTLGSAPTKLACDPTGKVLLVTDNMDDTVTSLTIDAKGALAVATTLSLPSGTGVTGVAISPDSKFAYVTGNTLGNATTLSLEVGTAKIAVAGAPVMTQLANAGPLAIDPKGAFVYVTTADASVPEGYVVPFARDPASGALAQKGTPQHLHPGLPTSIVVDAAGKNCYVPADNANHVNSYVIGALGGLTLNSPGHTPTGTTPAAIALDASGKFAYAVDSGTDDIQVMTIDATGELQDVGAPWPLPSTAAGAQQADCICVK